jgi:hypothetical protein
MTITLFTTLVSILSLISSLVTEVGKKNEVIKANPTVFVAVASMLCGWGGGIAAYILMGIAFTSASIVCLILLAPTIFFVATLGYDKVMEVIMQIGKMAK